MNTTLVAKDSMTRAGMQPVQPVQSLVGLLVCSLAGAYSGTLAVVWIVFAAVGMNSG